MNEQQSIQLDAEVLMAELDRANVENGRLRLINATLQQQLAEARGDTDPPEET